MRKAACEETVCTADWPCCQDKTYPRDVGQRGRIRVILKDAVSGEPVNSDIKTSALRTFQQTLTPASLTLIAERFPSAGKELLRKIAEAIPNLKVRKEGKPKPPGWMDIIEPGTPEAAALQAAQGAPQPPAGGNPNKVASSSKKKKKG